MVTDEGEPEEFRDSHWTEAAQRWLFYDATHLSDERIEEIVESHNQHSERELENKDFRPFEEMEILGCQDHRGH